MSEVRKAGFIQKILLVLELRERYRIEGGSMEPVLHDGDEVVVDEKAKVGIGDIVIASHPFKKSVEMAKRITAIDANGKFFLVGDNADESTDSRTFGPVPIECIKGKITARLT